MNIPKAPTYKESELMYYVGAGFSQRLHQQAAHSWKPLPGRKLSMARVGEQKGSAAARHVLLAGQPNSPP